MEAKAARRLLESYGLTPFQKRVLLATLSIPKGETRTYKEIAAAVRRPKACRAVGNVMGINPLAPEIPCHRVVRSDGRTGNYSAPGGRRAKERLLKAEGAL